MIFGHLFMAWIRRYKPKRLISKISVVSNFMFSSYACLCGFYCSHRTTVLNKVSCMRFYVKIALISYWNDFSLITLGEVCFLEESYENMQKIQNFESALYSTSGSMPLTHASLFFWSYKNAICKMSDLDKVEKYGSAK